MNLFDKFTDKPVRGSDEAIISAHYNEISEYNRERIWFKYKPLVKMIARVSLFAASGALFTHYIVEPSDNTNIVRSVKSSDAILSQKLKSAGVCGVELTQQSKLYTYDASLLSSNNPLKEKLMSSASVALSEANVAQTDNIKCSDHNPMHDKYSPIFNVSEMKSKHECVSLLTNQLITNNSLNNSKGNLGYIVNEIVNLKIGIAAEENIAC